MRMLRALTAVVALAVLFVGQSPVSAASTTFGAPAATSVYLKGITFTQPAVLSAVPTRVELLVEEPGLPGAAVTEVQAPSHAGQVQLQSVLDTAQGELVTNTTVTARWRVTFADGTSETGPPTTVTYADTRFQWRTMTGSVVRIHWYQGGDSFGRQAVALGDGAIGRAAKLLGVSVTEPIDFFVYADSAAFSDALGPGSHENVAGEAHPEIRTMFGLITPDEIGTSEVSRVVTHELTHLVFDTATKNPYHEPLHWLNEGVAVYLSQGFDSSDRSLLSGAVGDRTVMPLEALVGNFPSQYDRFSLAYAEAVSAVDFIVRTHGQDALVNLIRSYAGGVTDDEAFTAALGLDTKAFGKAWLASIGASVPPAFGPQPAPPGPTPAGWTNGGGAPAASAPAAGSGEPAIGSPAATGTPAVGQSGDATTPRSGGLSGLIVPVALVLVAVGGLGLLLLVSGQRAARGPQ